MAWAPSIDLAEIAKSVGLRLERVEAVVELLDAGNTVPFITRYRKDQTGGLDEEQVRAVQSRVVRSRMLAERKQTILRSIDSQGKLTQELAAAIQAADTTKRLEDLYLPFKPKKQTLATAARARGLEPLAIEILAADAMAANLDARAQDFVNPDKKVGSAADALLGAGHILAETFSERADFRGRIRAILEQTGKLVSVGIVNLEKDKGSERDDAERQSNKQPAKAAGETHESGATDDDASDATAAQARDAEPASAEPADAETPAEPVDDTLTFAVHEGAEPPIEGGDPAASDAPAMPREEVDDTIQFALPADEVSAASERATDDDVSASEQAGEHAAVQQNLPGFEQSGPAQGDAADRNAHADAAATEMTADGAAAAPSTEESAADLAAAPAVAQLTPRTDAKKRAKEKKADKRKIERDKRDEWKLKAFRDYFQYSEALSNIPPHRILAINRGERARALRVRCEYDLDAMYQVVDEMLVPADHPHSDFLRGCGRDALVRLVVPSLERELRREQTERAEARAVEVFARNLRNLLLQPPVRDRRVMAVDPGHKSGCKLCVLDEFGNPLEHAVIYLVGKPERREEAKTRLLELVRQHQVSVVAIGNGTGCRELEQWLSDVIAGEPDLALSYVIVNEAGASVYSTSRLGREEFPQYDATVRGAVSIGRRLQDPLSELVKIEPPSIGVGLYQHDVKAKHLRESLDAVVESCVNYVGVDLNTASSALLQYVSGLNQLTAQRVYDYRQQHGPFKRREDLKEVAGFGESTFVQAAGFLKISGGDDPLDATWIHPESYAVAEKVLEKLSFTKTDLADKEKLAELAERTKTIDDQRLAAELGAGALTLADIVAQLVRPGRDPRESLTPPMFKKGVLKLDDLAPGMELSGTVLNVVDFGAFVDIGLKDTGLVHISQLADKYVEDPHSVVAVGDIVKVWVIEVDKQRRRVSLTMIAPGSRRQHETRRHERSRRPAAVAQTAGGAPAQQQSGSRPARPPRHDQQKRRFGKKPQQDGGGAPAQHEQVKQPARPKPPKPPAKPLSKAKLQGRAPLQTFGELFQYMTRPEPPPASDDAKPSS